LRLIAGTLEVAMIPVASSAAPQAAASPALEMLARGIPDELVGRLRSAAHEARASQLARLAEQVAEHSPDAAAAIRALTHDFRYGGRRRGGGGGGGGGR